MLSVGTHSFSLVISCSSKWARGMRVLLFLTRKPGSYMHICIFAHPNDAHLPYFPASNQTGFHFIFSSLMRAGGRSGAEMILPPFTSHHIAIQLSSAPPFISKFNCGRGAKETCAKRKTRKKRLRGVRSVAVCPAGYGWALILSLSLPRVRVRLFFFSSSFPCFFPNLLLSLRLP